MNIYDVTGRLVRTLVNELQKPGYYRVLWDGKDDLGKAVASGIYFYRIEAGDFTAVKKIVKTI
jgi:flagellar hook assembly protein FlgD